VLILPIEPAYILFGDTGGEFAFGCVTGSFPYASDLRRHRLRLGRQQRNGRGLRRGLG